MGHDFSKEKAAQNRAALISMLVTNIILVVCYALEVVKGDRTIVYYAIFSALAIIPGLICFIIYRKKKDAPKLSWAIAIGFLILYAFTIFTTTSPIAYVYIFMIAIGLVAYSNIRLMNVYMIVALILNIVQSAIRIVSGLEQGEMANIEIRIASLILFTIYAAISSKTIARNNQSKMDAIEVEKNRIAEIMEKVLAITGKMGEDIASIHEKSLVMGELAEQNLSAMEEVTNGNNETVNSVEMQLIKTNDIKEAIEQVSEASGLIVADVEETGAELAASKVNIDRLIEHVNISYKANENVSKELAELTEYTTQMEDIISLIDGITSQTSLLSLNASIEAARAGEAGRGFAVVASEISNLANQTQDATVSITDLIKNISDELTKVVNVIQEMIENANEQNEAAAQTATSFDKITEKTEAVSEQAKAMAQLVSGLTEANNEIVKGIETISAVAEEVTANSSMTFESSSENKRVSEEVGEIVESLNESAKALAEIDK